MRTHTNIHTPARMRWWCTEPTASRAGRGGLLGSMDCVSARSDSTTHCSIQKHTQGLVCAVFVCVRVCMCVCVCAVTQHHTLWRCAVKHKGAVVIVGLHDSVVVELHSLQRSTWH
jgi:hypothetical protein